MGEDVTTRARDYLRQHRPSPPPPPPPPTSSPAPLYLIHTHTHATLNHTQAARACAHDDHEDDPRGEFFPLDQAAAEALLFSSLTTHRSPTSSHARAPLIQTTAHQVGAIPDHPRRRRIRPRLQPDHARDHQARGASSRLVSRSPQRRRRLAASISHRSPTPPPHSSTTPPSAQFPNAASDPQGDHGRRLQTLEDAYREAILEQAVDAALADARARNSSSSKGSSKSSSKGSSS